MYIQWIFSATHHKEVPFVTFIKEKGWHNFLKAKEYYELTDEEAATVRAGAAGLMSLEDVKQKMIYDQWA
jgi:hypothetical protein